MNNQVKKVAIIGTAGVPARYGGFETLTEHLVDQLGSRLDFSVYCTTKKYAKHERHPYYKEARCYYVPLKANGWQSIPYDILSMLHAILKHDILVILGVSGAIMIPFLRFFTNKRIVTHLDGLEWKRDKWKGPIKRFLHLCEKLAVRFSHEVISDNEGIRKYIKESYDLESTLIEYGADHAQARAIKQEDTIRYPFLKNPYAFKVCRIVPENNLDMILEAFSKCPSKILVFVGNWNNSEYGINLRDKYKNYENIHLLDPIYDPSELGLLRSNCFLYMHGHSVGGTNPSLVEAMFLGLPIASFDVIFNRETTENKAFYFKNAETLIELLENTPSQTIVKCGYTMSSIADRRYRWSIIASKYGRAILGGIRKIDSSSSRTLKEEPVPTHLPQRAKVDIGS